MRQSVLLILVQAIVWQVTVASPGQFLYWVDTTGVYRSTLDGSDVTVVVDTTIDVPMGIAIHEGHGTLYWAEYGANVIRRANLDGSEAEVFVQADGPFGVTLDRSGGKLYWTEYLHRIGRVNLDGNDFEYLALDGLFENPVGLVLDEQEGMLYWATVSDFFVGKIQRAPKDGGVVEDLVVDSDVGFWGIGLDNETKALLWTDSWGGKVQRAHMDGSNVTTVINGVPMPLGLALNLRDDHMYWIDQLDSGPGTRIRRANLDGSMVEDIVKTALDAPGGIAVYLPPVYGDVFPLEGDSIVDVDDLLYVLDGFADPGRFPTADLFPCNGNGIVDVDDILAELDAFSGSPACKWSNGMWVLN